MPFIRTYALAPIAAVIVFGAPPGQKFDAAAADKASAPGTEFLR